MPEGVCLRSGCCASVLSALYYFRQRIFSVLRRFQRSAGPVLPDVPRRDPQRQLGLELDNRPRRKFRRFLLVLPARQPVFLADHPVPELDGAVPDGAAAHSEIRLRDVYLLPLPEPLCPPPGLRHYRRDAVCVFRLFHLQHFFQPFSRSHRLLPADAVGAGRIHVPPPPLRLRFHGVPLLHRQLLLLCGTGRFPPNLLDCADACRKLEHQREGFSAAVLRSGHRRAVFLRAAHSDGAGGHSEPARHRPAERMERPALRL